MFRRMSLAMAPSRQFAAGQYFGRFWSKADASRQAKPAGSVEK
jgi:hypothetical protein